MVSQMTIDGPLANQRIGRCVLADRENGFYSITSSTQWPSLAKAVAPWSLAELAVEVIDTELRGYSPYNAFANVRTHDNERIACLLVELTTPLEDE